MLEIDNKTPLQTDLNQPRAVKDFAEVDARSAQLALSKAQAKEVDQADSRRSRRVLAKVGAAAASALILASPAGEDQVLRPAGHVIEQTVDAAHDRIADFNDGGDRSQDSENIPDDIKSVEQP
jgi:hypothetical protein